MRYLTALLALALASPAAAQTCDLTGTGGAYYSVWHADTLVSTHSREHTATVAAMALEEANPLAVTEVRFPTNPLRVECSAPRVDTVYVEVGGEDPGPDPEPEPEPDPTPEPGTGPAVGNSFSARWTNGDGTGVTAITDGGRFRDASNGQGVLSVVRAASAGLPAEWGGVIRTRMMHLGWGQMTATVAPQSTTHWGRVYYRSDAGRRSQHGSGYITSAAGGAFNHWQLLSHAHYGGSSATAPLQWGIRMAAPYPNSYAFSPRLEKGTWYRFEWQIEYVTPTTVRIWPRIYDLAGELVADSDDFTNEEGRSSLTALYAGGHTIGLGSPEDAANAVEARDFTIGSEGPSDANGYNPTPPAYIYMSAFDVSTVGWIGR